MHCIRAIRGTSGLGRHYYFEGERGPRIARMMRIRGGAINHGAPERGFKCQIPSSRLEIPDTVIQSTNPAAPVRIIFL